MTDNEPRSAEESIRQTEEQIESIEDPEIREATRKKIEEIKTQMSKIDENSDDGINGSDYSVESLLSSGGEVSEESDIHRKVREMSADIGAQINVIQDPALRESARSRLEDIMRTYEDSDLEELKQLMKDIALKS
ncbi:MAG: hypothetical protein WCR17_01490 [Candidatus Methanomethylophilaceae archaeon]|jgi:uncharacterized membrane-anchored protein YjiN (DUF445 family)